MEMKGFDDDALESAISESGKGSHSYIIDSTFDMLKILYENDQIDFKDYKNFRNDICDIKGTRVIADYKKRKITREEAEASLSKSNSLLLTIGKI